MKRDDLIRATARINYIKDNIAEIEYIDANVPDLLGKRKLVSILELPEDQRMENGIVTVWFSSVPLDRTKYTQSQLLFNQYNEKGIVSIS